MEDMLDVYTRPYDPRRPQVCLDESSVQLIGETRTPVPMAPVQPARYDFESGWTRATPSAARVVPRRSTEALGGGADIRLALPELPLQ